MGWAAHVAVKALDTSPRLAVREAASAGLVLWYAQFALNMAWTPLFFGAHKVSACTRALKGYRLSSFEVLNLIGIVLQTGVAACDILALWGTVAALTVSQIRSLSEKNTEVLIRLCPLIHTGSDG